MKAATTPQCMPVPAISSRFAAASHCWKLRLPGKPQPSGLRSRPERHRGEQLLGDVDQHQRHEDLVGAEPHLQDRRDHRPGPAAERAREHHQRKDQHASPTGRRPAPTPAPQIAPMMYCPSAPMFQIPARKPERQPDRDQDQRPGLHQQLRPRNSRRIAAEERIPEDRPDRLHRVLAEQREHHARRRSSSAAPPEPA